MSVPAVPRRVVAPALALLVACAALFIPTVPPAAADAVPVSTQSLITRPAAPTGLIATVGEGSATISFTAGSDGGSAITKYQVKVGYFGWVDAGTTPPITISGLADNSTKPVRVRAVNAVGNGVWSAPVTVRPRLAGPTLDAASATGRSSIHVEFSGGTVLGAHRNLGYTATAYLRGTSTAVSTCHTAWNGSACDILSLTRNTQYDIRVVRYYQLTPGSATRQTLESNTIAVTTNI